jgi:hypothetical protein
MKVSVYFCKEESEVGSLLKNSRISLQALYTLYDLVWESEFKNILNVGIVWLKFREQDKPFGIPLRDRKSHSKISPGDIIQIGKNFYIVDYVGAKKIMLVD